MKDLRITILDFRFAFLLKFSILILFVLILQSCGPYSFTGADINYTTTKTVQVNYFQNNAPIVEPGIARDFTQKN